MSTSAGFSEKSFYLGEFRGRSLVFAVPGDASSTSASADVAAALNPVVGELAEHRTRVLILSADEALLAACAPGGVVAEDDPGWIAAAWRAGRSARPVGLCVPGEEALPAAAARVGERLRIAKLVWLHADGPLRRSDGERISFLPLEQLAQRRASAGLAPWAREGRWLEAIEALLQGGLPSVSRCSPAGLEQELFTYAGSGTFFAREQYTEVRRLALDEFDAASDLIRRGEQEGYLVPRSDEALDRVLENAFGAFVEGRFLAGLGALLPYEREGCAEIASLYTVTRFLGEGVGHHLVRFALEEAGRRGFDRVFACTTSGPVERFFERHGFRVVDAEALPAARWRGYDPARRAKLRCLQGPSESWRAGE